VSSCSPSTSGAGSGGWSSTSPLPAPEVHGEHDDIELTAPDDDAVVEQVQAALVPGDAPPDAVGDDAGA